jgi:hypothetical protein
VHILHSTGIGIIISLLVTGALLLVQIVKMEKEILAEKNERSKKATDSQLAEDISE